MYFCYCSSCLFCMRRITQQNSLALIIVCDSNSLRLALLEILMALHSCTNILGSTQPCTVLIHTSTMRVSAFSYIEPNVHNHKSSAQFPTIEHKLIHAWYHKLLDSRCKVKGQFCAIMQQYRSHSKKLQT